MHVDLVGQGGQGHERAEVQGEQEQHGQELGGQRLGEVGWEYHDHDHDR